MMDTDCYVQQLRLLADGLPSTSIHVATNLSSFWSQAVPLYASCLGASNKHYILEKSENKLQKGPKFTLTVGFHKVN